MRRPLLLLFVLLCLPRWGWAEPSFPVQANRILFLGDSITHNGRYVSAIEAQLRLHGIDPLPQFINIGLSSETCSGLSEPGHPFPRPDVHERLGRALAKIKPDVVVACYGMNDGIYHPFSDERFVAYQEGVNRLIEKVHAADARLVLMTPPPFDSLPLKDKGTLKPAGQPPYGYTAVYENYDDVLARYAQWMMQQRGNVEMVIDLHKPLKKYVAEQRQTDPDFTLAPDGVHPNETGHQLIAETILNAWGIDPIVPAPDELVKAVHRRMSLLHNAWLSKVGHQRPGVTAGLSLEVATARAKELDAVIESLVEDAKQPSH